VPASAHLERAEAVGDDRRARVAPTQVQYERRVDLVAAELDLAPAVGTLDAQPRRLLPVALAQVAIVEHRLPATLAPDEEAIALVVGLEADRRAAHLRFLAREHQQLRQPLGLEAQAAVEAADRQRHDADQHAGDHHRDEQFEQREARLARPGLEDRPVHALHGLCASSWDAVRGAGYRFSDQLPMSAATPSPPGCPSAPRLNTSISPRTPGLRYW